MDTVLITDDEAVALAVDARSYWPGVLPSLDVEDHEELAVASFRGRRSLLVRQLADLEGHPVDWFADLVGSIPGRSDRLEVYLGGADFTRAGLGLDSLHYPGADPPGEVWVVETITPMGIHQISRQSDEMNRSYLTALLATAFNDGPPANPQLPDADNPVWLCVGSGAGERPVVVAVRQGEVCAVHPAGGVAGEPEPLTDDIPAAVDLLLSSFTG